MKQLAVRQSRRPCQFILSKMPLPSAVGHFRPRDIKCERRGIQTPIECEENNRIKYDVRDTKEEVILLLICNQKRS